LTPTRLSETDLYDPVRDYLVAQGYRVHGEVRGCDIVASKGDDIVVVELKRFFSTELLIQATERQRLTESVYVALPAPRGRRDPGRWRGIRWLLQRLELGLILVSFGAAVETVEVVLHPLPRARRRDARERRAVIVEVAGRSGDNNRGGSSRRPLMTAYREAALYVAYCLNERGESSPQQLRAIGCGPKTQSILARDHYGWFERAARGRYRLRPAGCAALTAQPALCATFGERCHRGTEDTEDVIRDE